MVYHMTQLLMDSTGSFWRYLGKCTHTDVWAVALQSCAPLWHNPAVTIRVKLIALETIAQINRPSFGWSDPVFHWHVSEIWLGEDREFLDISTTDRLYYQRPIYHGQEPSEGIFWILLRWCIRQLCFIKYSTNLKMMRLIIRRLFGKRNVDTL